jgi:hypothetical protein
VFIRLYVQNVRPHFKFAVPAWSPWLETDEEALEKVPTPRRAIQMVSGFKAHTNEARLKASPRWRRGVSRRTWYRLTK